MRRCSFLREFGGEEAFSSALDGFLRVYCHGRRRDECLRKRLAERLGRPESVPANMLPNGLPVSGTSTADWPEAARRIRHMIGVTSDDARGRAASS